MKLTTFLAAFAGLGVAIASPTPMPTGLTGNPTWTLLKRGVRLIWDPPNAYKGKKKIKQFWEDKCRQALARDHCPIGIIHSGEIRRKQPDGGIIRYVNVEGKWSMDMKDDARKMHVFQDGSSEPVSGWSAKEQKAMSQSKCARNNWTTPKPKEDREVVLSWNPADSYAFQRKRKAYWEDKCVQALAREGCRFGIIHKGETRLTRNGQPASYLNVEGSRSMDMANSKKMRVYQDSSTEDFNNWSEHDQRLIAFSKYCHRSRRRHRPFQDQGIQDHSERNVSWNPPNAYLSHKRMRSSFERACFIALEREGCEYGVIQKGHHHDDTLKPDGTKLNYMNVVAGKRGNPASYMRLFEDGSSVWYPPGPLPKKDTIKGQLSQSANLGRFLVAGGGEGQYSQESSKRRRVGGDEYQYSPSHAESPAQFQGGDGGRGLNLNFPSAQVPTSQTASPERFHAPGRDGGGGIDLNFPPPEVESPERSHTSDGGE